MRSVALMYSAALVATAFASSSKSDPTALSATVTTFARSVLNACAAWRVFCLSESESQLEITTTTLAASEWCPPAGSVKTPP